MKLLAVFLAIFVFGSGALSAEENPFKDWTEPEIGLFVEFGPSSQTVFVPYQEEFSTQEITSLQAGKAVVTFEEPRLKHNKLALRLMAGYKLHKFIFFGEVHFMADEWVNAYSYSWADPKLKCNDRWNGPTGCEIAFIEAELAPLYSLGVSFNVWNDFYLTVRGQTQGIGLILGREAYGAEDEAIEKEIYSSRVFNLTGGLDYIITKRNSPLRLVASSGYGISREATVNGEIFYFNLTASILANPF